MTATKQTFETTARILRAAMENEVITPYQCGILARDFADAYAAQNPQFKRDLFIRATGLLGGLLK